MTFRECGMTTCIDRFSWHVAALCGLFSAGAQGGRVRARAVPCAVQGGRTYAKTSVRAPQRL